MDPMLMPTHQKPITMDMHKPGDTLAGTWIAMEDQVGIINKVNTVGVEIKRFMEITIANVI